MYRQAARFRTFRWTAPLIRGEPEVQQPTIPTSLHQALAKKLIKEGEVQGPIKGGWRVKIGKVECFCPASHMTIFNPQKGQRVKVNVIEICEENSRVVVSQRVPLEQARKKELKRLKSAAKAKQSVWGTICRVESYGAFVCFEHLVGLVHISQMGGGVWVRHPNDLLEVGDSALVSVISVESDRKISLSLISAERKALFLISEISAIGIHIF